MARRSKGMDPRQRTLWGRCLALLGLPDVPASADDQAFPVVVDALLQSIEGSPADSADPADTGTPDHAFSNIHDPRMPIGGNMPLPAFLSNSSSNLVYPVRNIQDAIVNLTNLGIMPGSQRVVNLSAGSGGRAPAGAANGKSQAEIDQGVNWLTGKKAPATIAKGMDLSNSSVDGLSPEELSRRKAVALLVGGGHEKLPPLNNRKPVTLPANLANAASEDPARADRLIHWLLHGNTTGPMKAVA